jgi:anti-anti-sigma factor
VLTERPGEITVKVERLPGNRLVVKVEGHLRLDVTACMHRILADELAAAPEMVVVDLTEVSFVDPAAVIVLASAAAQATDAAADFRLVDADGGPMRCALDAAELSELFEVFGSVSEALECGHDFYDDFDGYR